MSVTLGIDTSSTDLGVGLYVGDRPASSFSRFVRNSHAEHIAQAVAAVLENGGVRPSEVTHVALAAGPGSFTGLRIGFAFVKGFCLENGARVLPVSSLFILAHGCRSRTGTVVAAIDARRDRVFWSRCKFIDGSATPAAEDTCCEAAAFEGILLPDDAVIFDTMGYGRSTAFAFLEGRRSVFSVERFPLQRGLLCAAIGVARCSDAAAWQDSSGVQPAYLSDFTPPSRGKKRNE